MEKNGTDEIQKDANEHCPGPGAETAGKAESCQGCPNQEACATAPKGSDPDLVAIAERMATVKHKILVLSGKGGVGKSTFSAQLAYALAGNKDHQVGLLDIDICGPSIPKIMGVIDHAIHQSNLGWSPVYVERNLGVMSIGFMSDPYDSIIWSGSKKTRLIKQFLKDVCWGELDFLVIDAPPGTSDEHISIVQNLQATGIDGAIIVTTPQQVSLIDVRKEVNFCKKVGIRILGVVENMSGFCQKLSDFKYLEPGDNGEISSDVIVDALRSIIDKILRTLSSSSVAENGA